MSEYEITYLFVDGIAERLRPGGKREPVLAAWGFTIEGRRVLLHMMAGSKEDAETVTAFFEDMKRCGLNDPLLVTSDGAPVIKAIEVCFPRAARPAVPCASHAELGGQTAGGCLAGVQGPRAGGLSGAEPGHCARARGWRRCRLCPQVRQCGRLLLDDFEACIAHLRFPVTHRRAIRTTNLLERLFVGHRLGTMLVPGIKSKF